MSTGEARRSNFLEGYFLQESDALGDLTLLDLEEGENEFIFE